ncbi:MAG: hypothetical protein Q4G71_02760 [Pseudomonadota bacterium]|nr:hypothetical protein [Pseudomonadota bacterium]
MAANQFKVVVARPKPHQQVVAPVGIGGVDAHTPEVTPEVGRLLAVLQGDMGRAHIMAALGLKDEKHFREHYQQAAIVLGLIEMTLPDKPRSRLQKYRLTAAGQAWLDGHGGNGP